MNTGHENESANAREARSRAVKSLFAWALLTLALSVVPISSPVAAKFGLTDTVLHALFYMPLSALFLWSFPADNRLLSWARAAAAAFACGFAIELVQAALPWRAFQWWDAVADLAGGSAGAALALLLPGLPAKRLTRQGVR